MHYAGKHKGEAHPTKEECEVAEVPEDYTLKEPDGDKSKVKKIDTGASGQSKIYKEMPEPSSILREVLANFPGLQEDVTTEIMSWADMKGVLHPMEVGHLLSQMAGVPKGAVSIIPQKYQLAMQKAAAEGNADLQMTLTSWGVGSQQPPVGGFMPMSGLPGQIGPPMNMMGYPFGGGGYPGSTQYLGYPYPPPPPVLKKEEQEMNPEADARLTRMEEVISTLVTKITESEEQKKEAALNARLEKIENAIMAIAQNPNTGEGDTKSDETLKELRGEITALKAEITTNRIKILEDKITSLSTAISEGRQDAIGKLEEEIKGLKEGGKDKTGKNEMDVIASVLDKTLDTVKEAGKDIKSIVMAGPNRERFDPSRLSREAREAAGSKIAETLETEASVRAKEAAFIGG